MDTGKRVAEVRGLIKGDPSLPNFLLKQTWMRSIREAVEDGRVDAVLAEWRSWYSTGDATNGDHSPPDPPSYGDVPEDPFET